MAGLLPTATPLKNGFQLKDVAWSKITTTVAAKGTLNLGYVNGFVAIRNRSSSFSYLLYWCSKGYSNLLMGVDFTLPQTLGYDDVGDLVFTNTSSSARNVTIYWMELPDVS